MEAKFKKTTYSYYPKSIIGIAFRFASLGIKGKEIYTCTRKNKTTTNYFWW